MGGIATHLSALNIEKIKELNIGAAVSLHPVKSDKEGVNVPIMYAAGSADALT
jgi:hypothetical protein